MPLTDFTRVQAALLWVEAGEPDLPVELARMPERDRDLLIASARNCPPDRRAELLGRAGPTN